jgi:hypothetical protein
VRSGADAGGFPGTISDRHFACGANTPW